MSNQMKRWEPSQSNLGGDWFDDLQTNLMKKVLLASLGLGLLVWLAKKK